MSNGAVRHIAAAEVSSFITAHPGAVILRTEREEYPRFLGYVRDTNLTTFRFEVLAIVDGPGPPT